MRESQYVIEYLDVTRTRPITPGTYLEYTLRGRAKKWHCRYLKALLRALRAREKKGTVRSVLSVRGGIAYVWAD